MIRSTPNKYPVFLTADERQRLTEICRNGHSPAKNIRHAQVLLLSDRNRPEGRMTRRQIAETLGMHVNSVDRIRKRFVLEGEAPAVNRKVRQTPPRPPKIDGRGEAYLVALCCSKPPEGHICWTMKLLAHELKRNGVVTQVSAETVRRRLKKTNCSHGASSAGVFRSVTMPAS